ncbi:hypothetical protein JTB14_014871 [Gonioctena quinquepunctata]|nr:hypothetical protein JTB14_014871 [Gonioctena quinquepunctata]
MLVEKVSAAVVALLNEKLNNLEKTVTDLKTKIVEIKSSHEKKITELEKHINDLGKKDGNYSVYRKDRSYGSRGGGVLLAVDKDLFNSEEFPLTCSIEKIDILGVEIFRKRTTSVIILVVYIPPSISYDEYDELFEFFENFQENNKTIIIGDFNISELHDPENPDQHSNLVSRLNAFLNYCDSTQHNKICNANNRILDLVIAPSDYALEVSRDENTPVPIDVHHPGLLVNILLECEKIPAFTSNLQRFNFKKANIRKLSQLFSEVNWCDLPNFPDVNSASLFSTIPFNVFLNNVFLKKCRSVKYSLVHKRYYY